MNYLLFLTFLFAAEGIAAQPYFEGTLLYSHSIKSHASSADSIVQNLPKGSLYLYKNEFYKGYIFSKDTTVYIYHGGLAICMVKSSTDETVYCADYGKKIYEPQKIIVDKGQHNVNGYPCIMVTSRFKDYSVKSYYHINLRHHPEMFVKHRAYGFAKLMHAAKGGIFVKSEITYADYSMTIELVNIDQRIIPPDEFAARLFEDCKN